MTFKTVQELRSAILKRLREGWSSDDLDSWLEELEFEPDQKSETVVIRFASKAFERYSEWEIGSEEGYRGDNLVRIAENHPAVTRAQFEALDIIGCAGVEINVEPDGTVKLGGFE